VSVEKAEPEITQVTVHDIDHDTEGARPTADDVRGVIRLREERDRYRAALEKIVAESDGSRLGVIARQAIGEGEPEPTEYPEPESACDHEWIDMRNEAIISGEMCSKCRATRAGNAATDPPPAPVLCRYCGEEIELWDASASWWWLTVDGGRFACAGGPAPSCHHEPAESAPPDTTKQAEAEPAPTGIREAFALAERRRAELRASDLAGDARSEATSERCDSVSPWGMIRLCVRPPGHAGQHENGGSFWPDAESEATSVDLLTGAEETERRTREILHGIADQLARLLEIVGDGARDGR